MSFVSKRGRENALFFSSAPGRSGFCRGSLFWGVLIVTSLGAVVCASFLLGRYSVPPAVVLKIIFGVKGGWTDAQSLIVLKVRLPRIIAAIAVGSALSVSGATYQGVFRNPIVSPDILGASAGAGVGAALMMVLGFGSVGIQLGAFTVGIFAVALAYCLSRALGRGSDQTVLLVLSGLAVGTLFQSGISIMKYMADPDSKLPEITYWLMGSIARVTTGELKWYAIPYLIGVAPLLALRWQINALTFGDDEARSLGVNTELTRLISIGCATLLTAASVSIAGTVAWVGLMVPHLVRLMFGPNYKTVLPMSVLTGAVFLLAVDNLCRSLMAYEIPLGILTSMLGAPFFVLVLFGRKGRIS